jgi:hypothetical protein
MAFLVVHSQQRVQDVCCRVGAPPHKCPWSGTLRFTSWWQLRNDMRTEGTHSKASAIVTCGRDSAVAAHPPPPSSSFSMVESRERGRTRAWRQVIARPTICHRREARLTLAEALGGRPSIWGTRRIQVFQQLVSGSRCYFETDANRILEAEQERKDGKVRSSQA